MPQNARFDPFAAGDCWVADDEHVRVDRQILQTQAGPSIRYVKVFRKSAGYDYTGFNAHETELLLEFRRLRMSRVVQIARLDWSDRETFDRVETLDAGPSLNHWLSLPASISIPGPGGPPLADPRAFFALMRATLLALQELHSRNCVHCDIDLRNICMPFKAHSQRAGAFAPDWNAVRLIDFAFSLGPSHPLRLPLPVRPDPSLHSPAMMRALQEDYMAGTARQVRRLDGRVDIHALGLMAEKLLFGLRGRWLEAPLGTKALPRAEELVRALKAVDSAEGKLEPTLHARLLEPVDEFLRSSNAVSFEPAFLIATELRDSAAQGRPISAGPRQSDARATAAPTPLAPPAETGPRVNPPIIAAAAPTPLQARAPAVSPRVADAPAPTLLHATKTAGLARWRPRPSARAALPVAPASGVLTRFWHRIADSFTLERHRRRAAGGDAEACYRLAAVLIRGKAVEPDPQAALQWLLVAAHKGHAAAQAAAGSCFDIGYGSPEDPEQAAHWYTSAAQAGHPQGHYGLATLLSAGRGAPRDDAAAVYHLRMAAEAGLPEAYLALGQLILAGRGATANRNDAIECLRRAAEAGLGSAAHKLGELHEHPGPGVLPQPQVAKRWYRRAIKLGLKTAREDLARIETLYPT